MTATLSPTRNTCRWLCPHTHAKAAIATGLAGGPLRMTVNCRTRAYLVRQVAEDGRTTAYRLTDVVTGREYEIDVSFGGGWQHWVSPLGRDVHRGLAAALRVIGVEE